MLFQTPVLEGDRYYCVRVTSDHPFCRSLKPAPFLADPGVTRVALPSFCNFTSEKVFVSSMPFIAEWVPFCTSHFKCGWLYVTVVCSTVLVLSCLLAVIFVYCPCCCARRR